MPRCPIFNVNLSLADKGMLNVAGTSTLGGLSPVPELFAQAANFATYGFTPPPIHSALFHISRFVIQSNLKDGNGDQLIITLAAQTAGGFVNLVSVADGNGDWSGDVIVPAAAVALALIFSGSPASGNSLAGFYDWNL